MQGHQEIFMTMPSIAAIVSGPGARYPPVVSDSDELGALLEQELRRASIAGPSEAQARELGLAVARFLQRKNQFIDLGPERMDELSELAAAALERLFDALEGALTEDAVAEAAAAQLQGILDWLARREPAADVTSAALVRSQVVCSEYSPELQLRVLGIDVDDLLEPVLDLGCGEEARLVQYLRQRGIEAFGIDRVARSAPFVLPGDWFTRRLEPRTLGTVVSHMALSNHFVHQDRRGGPEAALYAHKYMEVLRSLLPGGLFAYAPSLPFIEEHLPEDEYTVERLAVRSESGEPLPYAASRVTRVE